MITRSSDPAEPASPHESTIPDHGFAAHEHRANRARHLEPFERRVVAGVVEVHGADGPARLGIEQHQVRVAPDLDGAFRSEPEPPRRHRGQEIDEALHGDPAPPHTLGVEDRENRFDPGRTVADFREWRGRNPFLHRQPVRHVVAGDEVERSIGEAGPERVPVAGAAQRRGDDVPDGVLVAAVVAIGAKDEIVRTGLRRDPNPGRLRPPDLVEREGRREVDDMHRRIGCVRERQRPMGRHGLGLSSPRGRVVARRNVAQSHRVGHGGIDQHRILAVHLEHAAGLAEPPHRVEQASIVQSEVEHHERLGRRHPGLDDRPKLCNRIVHPAADREARRDVDRRIPRDGLPPLAHPRHQGALSRAQTIPSQGC